MTDKMQSLALAPVGNLDSYIRAANAWPMLSADEERALAEKLHYHGDLEAAKTLILSHLRFVVHIARNYAGYGLPQADLIQEGNIGLMKAVRRFNPEAGFLPAYPAHHQNQTSYGTRPVRLHEKDSSLSPRPARPVAVLPRLLRRHRPAFFASKQ